HALEPESLLVAHARLGSRLLGGGKKVLRVTTSHLVAFATLLEPFRRKLTDRLEHLEPPINTAQQALVDKSGGDSEVSIANRLECIRGTSASEDGKAREPRSLALSEQLVTPLQRRP